MLIVKKWPLDTHREEDFSRSVLPRCRLVKKVFHEPMKKQSFSNLQPLPKTSLDHGLIDSFGDLLDGLWSGLARLLFKDWSPDVGWWIWTQEGTESQAKGGLAVPGIWNWVKVTPHSSHIVCFYVKTRALVYEDLGHKSLKDSLHSGRVS